ncbi:MAG: alcohol dehydrogenase catalytic domain-containing protein [Lachnospiraceae bacterium]|nr:alcohol dehydrogenase catalytic domain-containing protein [Lachnospiraceae bacterium]
MLNAVYQLKKPRQFELVFKDITFDQEHVIVRPTHLSICNADQRYYQGNRPDEILNQKLPMALIHEAIGKVVYDPTGQFQVGDRVVMIPNLPCEEDEVIAENYLRSSKFRASGTDGFMQEYVQTVPDRLVKLPDNINLTVAAFTEIVSVSYHAIDRFMKTAHERRHSIGVWGDGNLGYITSLLLKSMYPEIEVHVFGLDKSKLNDFTFADGIYLVNDIPKDFQIDHAFECVGGNGAPRAINQIIDYIRPEGTIGILGVTEDLAPINTRMILEKGLRMIGSSRSGREDFVNLVELYRNKPEVVEYLENIVGEQVVIREMRDISRAFEKDIHKLIGKTIMVWDK